MSRPQIAEAAVVGLPSEQWGSKIAAVIVLSPDAHATGRNGKSWGPMDMRRALKDRLAGYKIPQEMKVLETIPRNAMGKGELNRFYFCFPGVVGDGLSG
jgi:acyl-CoA synthetase (AMP-forming)/AMP-acid ligase II